MGKKTTLPKKSKQKPLKLKGDLNDLIQIALKTPKKKKTKDK